MIGTVHIVVAMKPLVGTFTDNANQFGVAGLNIDGTRIAGPKGDGVWGTSNKTIKTDRKFNSSPEMTEYRSEAHSGGRWPANVILEDSDTVKAGLPDRDGPWGKKDSMSVTKSWKQSSGKRRIDNTSFHGETGSVARFFKQVKEI